jgi:hypothetical protein
MVFRPSASRGHLFRYSIKRAFYGTVCYLISSKYPNALICFMDTIPFDLPDAAYAWADLSEAILEAGFDESAGPSRNLIDQWDEPDDPIWSILSANWLCENSESIRQQIDGITRNRSRLEQFLICLVRNFRQAITVKTTYSDMDQLQRLVLVQHVAELYSRVHGWGLQRCEGSLLQVLFASGHSTAIHLGVELLLTKPPVDWADVSLSLAPLMQSKTWPVGDVFPKLLQSTVPAVLSPALDVANFVVRSRSLPEHPANGDLPTLLRMMGGLVNQLGMLEENPAQFGSSVAAIQKILFDSVSLCVSLCDTLGLIGNQDAIGKLTQASKLSHRRIRTEAAFALAKLGDKKGQELLIELAADFSSRQRAVAYAEELGIDDRVDERWTTAAALAESRLANWLAQNEQMGISPSRMELLDQRTLSWPGFEQPQECFLFRFEYDMQDSIYSNVGFSGPMCHSFSQDLADISLEDTYSIFVGWDIDHPDAFEVAPNSLDARIQERMNRMLETLPEHVQLIETLFCVIFFEHFGILARVLINDELRIALVAEDDRVTCEPFTTKNQADPMLTYWLWRGRTFFESV